MAGVLRGKMDESSRINHIQEEEVEEMDMERRGDHLANGPQIRVEWRLKPYWQRHG